MWLAGRASQAPDVGSGTGAHFSCSPGSPLLQTQLPEPARGLSTQRASHGGCVSFYHEPHRKGPLLQSSRILTLGTCRGHLPEAWGGHHLYGTLCPQTCHFP
ncbi:unnamed protein product [Rangifer tarandus platyrhynchus]|uniref:Uncharacterized protein n=1 Tax=Rangifer tarandus platyrhynchus TaxID=3082113 RepID=A0AC59ZS05_RANTA